MSLQPSAMKKKKKKKKEEEEQEEEKKKKRENANNKPPNCNSKQILCYHLFVLVKRTDGTVK